MMTSLTRISGMVDPHVHLRDLEWSHKATFASETAAAVAGGYWAVLDMPNTPPPTIDGAALRLKRERMTEAARCDWGVYFGASQADNQAEYAAAAPLCCGLKIYNNATTGTLLIEDQAARERHFAAWPAHKPIAVHAEGDTVGDILALVRRYRKPVHFCHISLAQEIHDLRAAKAEGLPVTVGVTPHHLFLTEASLGMLGSFGLMKPELKQQADQDALWEAVRDGVVDVIESDHAPHTLAEKQSAKPPYGVPGLETTLSLLGLAAKEGRASLEHLLPMVSTNPQRIFGLRPPAETYTLVDFADTYTVTRAGLHSACGWSPFEGWTVRGRVREVWIRGVKVFDGERILAAPGFGMPVVQSL
jgi:carbamoyl-phosphate synthase/aspartate carbamoyltransferase/dihydroorotase